MSVVNQEGVRLVATPRTLTIESMDAIYAIESVPIARPAKLLAFFEWSQGDASIVGSAWKGPGVVRCEIRGSNAKRGVDRWLIERLVENDPQICEFKRFIRAQEAYRLVVFLLGAAQGKVSVGDLASRYGVSQAQFRRLCHEIWGCGLKRQLLRWRALSALHSVVCGDDSMTQVAYKHGYASSSHFSAEMKRHFGMCPGDFR